MRNNPGSFPEPHTDLVKQLPVRLFGNAVLKIPGARAGDSRLATEEAAHLLLKCRDASDALMAQRRQGRCPACLALFGEMRLAVNEAEAITQQARILIHASKPSEHVDAWQIRERGENARQKWLAAAASLKNHFATTPGHAGLNEHGPV